MIDRVNKSHEDASQNSSETKQTPTNLISRDSIIRRLSKGVETRARFVESHLSKHLAFQLRALREREGWSQVQLADKVEMNQNAISRLENPNYGKATLTTLRRIARTFDVAIIVRFVPFSQIADWVSGTPRLDSGLSPESLGLPSFGQEYETRLKLGSVEDNEFSRKQPQPDLGCLGGGTETRGAAADAVAYA